jgi:cytochrome oxidase Cu insertion factor (SCO1/SenC/PrrC family)
MKKLIIVGLLSVLLAGCAAVQQQIPQEPQRSNLKTLGTAPELTNTVWLNTDQPLRLSDLRGKVVLLDMWTFG